MGLRSFKEGGRNRTRKPSPFEMSSLIVDVVVPPCPLRSLRTFAVPGQGCRFRQHLRHGRHQGFKQPCHDGFGSHPGLTRLSFPSGGQEERKIGLKPLYNDLDVVETMGQFVTINYHRPINIAEGEREPDAGISWFGAGSMTLKAKNGAQRVLGFSGDLGRKNKPIIRDPEQLDGLDHLVLESTYGDKLHENTSDAVERLAEVVRSTAEAGGKVIIPAFAVERTQELVFTLHLLLDQGRIPDIPICGIRPRQDATESSTTLNATIRRSMRPLHPLENPFGFASLHFPGAWRIRKP